MICFLTSAPWKNYAPHLALVRAMRERGDKVMVLAPEELVVQVGGGNLRFRTVKGEALEPNLVFHRARRTPASQVLDLLEDSGARVVNSASAWRLCEDKALQAGAFARHRVPHPMTIFAPGGNARPLAAMLASGGQWVIKPREGRRGKGIRFLTDPESVDNLLIQGRGDQPDLAGHLLQRFVNDPQGPRQHVRCYVVGGKVLSAGTLTAKPGRLVTNHAQGGTWEPLDPVPEPIRVLALAAASALGADYTGVDLIADEAGSWWVLECNNMPDLRGPLIEDLADFLHREAEREQDLVEHRSREAEAKRAEREARRNERGARSGEPNARRRRRPPRASVPEYYTKGTAGQAKTSARENRFL